MHRIGIDLGGTNIAGGICDAAGNIIKKASVPTFAARGADFVIADIIALCRRLVSDSGLSFDDIGSIGIGCPGIVFPPDGSIVNAPNINFTNVPIGKIIGAAFDVPVIVENDANCAALGEAKFGAARGVRNSVTITLGTGIGGGIIINGAIYSGSFFGAGELGHHIICAGGEACGCGNLGCWEAYASATALIRDTKKAAKNDADSAINSLCGDNLDAITAKTAFDAALLGDITAKAVVENYLDNLCVGLANVVNILQPEIIVIGGGISGQGDALVFEVEDRTAPLVLGSDLKTRFAVAHLGNDAGIIGAAMLR